MRKINPDIYKDYYNAPYRAFHNLEHLEYVYKSLEGNIPYVPLRLEALIVCHDIVCYPGCSQNEELSALKARQLFPEYAEYLTEGILATKHHDSSRVSEKYRKEIELFLDADMSIIGADWSSVYSSYSDRIQNEYLLAGYSIEDYKKGRVEFLRGFNGFLTDEYKKTLDYNAKRNIDHELCRWSLY